MLVYNQTELDKRGDAELFGDTGTWSETRYHRMSQKTCKIIQFYQLIVQNKDWILLLEWSQVSILSEIRVARFLDHEIASEGGVHRGDKHLSLVATPDTSKQWAEDGGAAGECTK
jgi:hypothetical protein